MAHGCGSPGGARLPVCGSGAPLVGCLFCSSYLVEKILVDAEGEPVWLVTSHTGYVGFHDPVDAYSPEAP